MLIFAGRGYPELLRLARRSFPVQVASGDLADLSGVIWRTLRRRPLGSMYERGTVHLEPAIGGASVVCAFCGQVARPINFRVTRKITGAGTLRRSTSASESAIFSGLE